MNQEKYEYIEKNIWEHFYAAGYLIEEQYAEVKDKIWSLDSIKQKLIEFGFKIK